MSRVLALAALLLGLLLLGLPGPALAGATTLLPDVALRIWHVDDRSRLLDDAATARMSDALTALSRDEGYDLYVVHVRSFGGVDPDTWAFDQLRRIGPDDHAAVLAVAVDDRAYALAVPYDSDFPRTTFLDVAGPRLDRGDWAGGVIAGADAVHGWTRREVQQVLIAGGITLPLLLLVIVTIYASRHQAEQRRRSRTTPPPPPPADPAPGVPTRELTYRADSALIALDDAVRLREHDLLAVRATFGKAEITSLARALHAARTELMNAFPLRERADDQRSEPHRRVDLHRIVTGCTAARERLDGALAEVNRLYDLEQNVETALAHLRDRVGTVAARLSATTATLDGLRARYTPFAVAAVTDNVTEAAARVADARAGLAGCETETAAGRTPAAAVALRGAEDAVGRATTLLDAVDRLARELLDAGARFVEAAAEVRADLAEARVRNADGRDEELGAAVGRAREALRTAGPEVAAGGGDPFTALRSLDAAGAALDRALANGAATRAVAARVAPQFERAVLTARSGIGAVDDLLARGRHTIGGPARVRLATARRLLDGVDDLARRRPGDAVAQARRADALAQEARRLAEVDVAEHRTEGHGDPRPPSSLRAVR